MGLYQRNRIGDYGIIVRAVEPDDWDDPVKVAAAKAATASKLESVLPALRKWATQNKPATLYLDGHFLWDNNAGTGYLEIQQETANVTIPMGIRMIGLGSGAIIEISKTGSGPIRWNAGWTWSHGVAPYTISVPYERCEYFTITGYAPSVGEWFQLASDDPITTQPPWSSGEIMYPMELHQVVHVVPNNGGYDCYVESPIIDKMTTNARAVPQLLTKDVIIENLSFICSEDFTPSNYSSMFWIKSCENLRIHNLHFDRQGPGCFRLDGNAKVEISDCTFGGSKLYQGTFAITHAGGNGLVVTDNIFTGYRIGMISQCTYTSSNDWWGTPLNVLVDGNTFNVHREYDGDEEDPHYSTSFGVWTQVDWGAIFQNNRFNIQAYSTTKVASFVGRNTVFRQNTVVGGNTSSDPFEVLLANGMGVEVLGPNTLIEGNTFENLWRGVDFARHANRSYYAHGSKVIKNTFINIRALAVIAKGCDDIQCEGNTYINCGSTANTSPQGAATCIQFGALNEFDCSFQAAGTTLTITGNTMWTDLTLSSAEGQTIFFKTDDTLPAGLTAYTPGADPSTYTYYVLVGLTATTCTISATRGGGAITFPTAGSGNHHCYGSHLAGTGHIVQNETALKVDNDSFLEMQNARASDIQVYGCTVMGYDGDAFEDTHGNQAAFQTAYEDFNTHDAAGM